MLQLLPSAAPVFLRFLLSSTLPNPPPPPPFHSQYPQGKYRPDPRPPNYAKDTLSNVPICRYFDEPFVMLHAFLSWQHSWLLCVIIFIVMLILARKF